MNWNLNCTPDLLVRSVPNLTNTLETAMLQSQVERFFSPSLTSCINKYAERVSFCICNKTSVLTKKKVWQNLSWSYGGFGFKASLGLIKIHGVDIYLSHIVTTVILFYYNPWQTGLHETHKHWNSLRFYKLWHNYAYLFDHARCETCT